MSIMLGDIVRYSKPEPNEVGLRFTVVGAPEKGRVDIELICDMPIRPIETVRIEDVELSITNHDWPAGYIAEHLRNWITSRRMTREDEELICRFCNQHPSVLYREAWPTILMLAKRNAGVRNDVG